MTMRSLSLTSVVLALAVSTLPAVAAPPQKPIVTPAAAEDEAPFVDEVVPVNESRLSALSLSLMIEGSVIELPTANGPMRMRLIEKTHTYLGSDIYTFFGDASTGAPFGANAQIAVRDGLVGGFVRAIDGFDVTVTPLDEDRQSLTFKPSNLDSCGNGPGTVVLPQDGGGGVACADALTRQDVLVVYTPAAAAANGGTAAITLLIEAGIADANTALKNTHSPNRLRLVNAYGYAFPESGDIGTDLDALRNPTDGIGDFVHTLRDAFAADLVQLVCVSSGACGVASLFSNDPAMGFSVVESACLSGYVQAHEIGHNFGCCHAVGDGGGCDNGGYFPYSNGWRFNGNSGTLWRTVMAYDPGTRIPYFSNPLVTFDGKATGKAGLAEDAADNARTIALTAQAIANFRCSDDPINDCNGNGVPDDIDIADGTSPDCNDNNVPDACDIAGGFSKDADLNGIPDECGVLPSKFYPDDDSDPRVLDSAGFSVAMGRGLVPVGQTVPLNAVIGAFGDDEAGSNVGAAYAFNSAGVQQAKLLPADPDPQSNFGRAVDTWSFIPTGLVPKREFAIVGAYRADVSTLSERGAVYIYSSDNDGPWTQRLKQVAGDGKANDWFGFAVNFSRSPADTQHNLFVGAPHANNGKGAVYIYKYADANTAALSKKLILPLSTAGADFGWSLASDNFVTLITTSPVTFTQRAILAVGSPGFASGAGMVRVFERPVTSNASYPSAGVNVSLGSTLGIPGDRFGESVSIADNYMAIGAPGRDSGRGSVFIFERTNVNVWTFREEFKLPNAKANDKFGTAVSLTVATDGAIWLAAGAPRYDVVTANGTLVDAGLGFIRRKPANSPTWIAVAPHLPTDSNAGDQFGAAAAIFPDGGGVRALFGAPFDDDTGLNSGSAYFVIPSSSP